MVCSNCGNTLKENEKFCTLCGTYNDPSSSLEPETKSQPKKKKKIIKTMDDLIDDDLIEEEIGEVAHPYKIDNLIIQEYNPKDDPEVIAYIGEDYKWIAERPFNIYALLLSWIYFIYRKLYLIGIIGLAITGIIYKFFPIVLIPYIIVSMVGSGFVFNKIYLDIVEDRVAKLQKKSQGIENMEELCKRKGGVTVIMPLIIFAIFLAIMLSSYIHINVGTQNKEPNFWEETSINSANCKSICRDFYGKNQTAEETVEELGCEVISNTSGNKVYKIYIKSTKNGKTRYVLYEDDPNGFITQKGDSDLITEYEKYENQLSEQDKEFLQTSRTIANELLSLKSTSESEDSLIKRYENTAPKTHFFYTKDDIFK